MSKTKLEKARKMLSNAEKAAGTPPFLSKQWKQRKGAIEARAIKKAVASKKRAMIRQQEKDGTTTLVSRTKVRMQKMLADRRAEKQRRHKAYLDKQKRLEANTQSNG